MICAPSMGAILEVKVLPRAGHSERSEAQLREGDRAWEGSVGRIREPMDKNRIRGTDKQGEQAVICEALVAKAKLCICGGCAEKDCVLTWGDLALCPKGRRQQCWSEESAAVVLAGVPVKDQTRRRVGKS